MKCKRIIIGGIVLVLVSALFYVLVDHQWDSIRIYYDLDTTYTEPSATKGKDIETYLWDYKFETKTVSKNDETLYGVQCVTIHFIKKDTTYIWLIRPDFVLYEEIVDESPIISKLYDGKDGEIYRSVLKLLQE